MNIALLLIIALLLGARKGNGGGSAPAPPPAPGCAGCCPGTSTYEGMLKARSLLQSEWGTWSDVPLLVKLAHIGGYGQCPGYADF